MNLHFFLETMRENWGQQWLGDGKCIKNKDKKKINKIKKENEREGDEGCRKWRWHRQRQLVDDDWPAMGMKMGFMGNQKKQKKKKKWGMKEEEMEAERACGNGLFNGCGH